MRDRGFGVYYYCLRSSFVAFVSLFDFFKAGEGGGGGGEGVFTGLQNDDYCGRMLMVVI